METTLTLPMPCSPSGISEVDVIRAALPRGAGERIVITHLWDGQYRVNFYIAEGHGIARSERVCRFVFVTLTPTRVGRCTRIQSAGGPSGRIARC